MCIREIMRMPLIIIVAHCSFVILSGLPDRNKFPVYYGLGQTYMELRDFELSIIIMNLQETFSSDERV